MMRCYRGLLVAGWFVLLVASADAGFLLRGAVRLVHQGDERSLPIILSGGHDPVRGFSFGLAHESSVAALLDIVPGSAIDAVTGGLGAEFFGVDLSPTGGTGGTVEAIIDSTGATSLPPGWPKVIVRFEYAIHPDAPLGLSFLPLTDELGEPPVDIELVLADPPGELVSPFTLPGLFIVFPGDGSTQPGVGVPGQMWFVSRDDNAITIVGPDGTVLDTLPTTAVGPSSIAIDANGTTWIAFAESDRVVRYTNTGEFIDEITVDDEPVAITIDAEGNGWVSCAGDQVLDKIAATGELLFGGFGGGGPTDGVLGAAISVPGGPNGLATDRLGNVFVVSTDGGTLRKLGPNGGTVRVIDLQPTGVPAQPEAVALDRRGFIWSTVRSLDRVDRRASDGSLVESFELPMGAAPVGVALRTGEEAWVLGSGDGQLYRLRPGGEIDAFFATPSPSGVAVGTDGSIWVTDDASNVALRFDRDGQLLTTVSVGSGPSIVGDAGGLVPVNVFFARSDLDGDGFASGIEIDAGTDPTDADSTPTSLPGFVVPVDELQCRVELDEVLLEWTLPDSAVGSLTPYDTIEIHRDSELLVTLPADAIEYVDLGIASGPYEYEVRGVSGSDVSPARRCTVVVAQGNVTADRVVELAGLPVQPFGFTIRPEATDGEPLYYFTDPAEGRIYGTDADYQVIEIFDSPLNAAPFGGGGISAPTTGIAYRAAGNGGLGSLVVAAGSTGDPDQVATVHEMTLEGEPLGSPVTLERDDPVLGVVPIRGGLSGIAIQRDTGLATTIGPDVCELYSFVLGGGSSSLVLAAASASHPTAGAGLNGLYFPPFTSFGPDGGRVRTTGVSADGRFEITELEIVDGVATVVGDPVPLAGASEENSFGGLIVEGDAVVAIGLTTAKTYELGSAFFRRGDIQGDEALDLADPISILDACFGGAPFRSCIDRYDTNDSGFLDIADSVYLLEYLFIDGPAPPAPLFTPGPDATPDGLPCL